MTKEEWETSLDAPAMLASLRQDYPRFLRSQIEQLHKFLIACCWKHQELIPQKGLRDGLKGAESWLANQIDTKQLDRLNYFAEAEVFKIEYAETIEQIDDLKRLIDGVELVRSLPFDEARARLLRAAYFAEGAMIYPRFDDLPWVDSLFTSEFLCPNLLREHLKPNFKVAKGWWR
jgi:hypothetical protein